MRRSPSQAGTARSRRAQNNQNVADVLANSFKHVCKVEYNHAVDRDILYQLRMGVLRIDVDACTVHELQIFKGFFSRLPRIQQLCVAKGQVPMKPEHPIPRPTYRSLRGSRESTNIRQTRANAVKKASQGILHLIAKLLRTPRHCQLVSLALPGLTLTESTIASFEEGFRACNSLRELDLREQDLSRPSVAERVLRAVTASSSVQALCIKRCRITSRSARYIAYVLRANNERRDQLIWKGELRGEPVSKKAIRQHGLLVLDASENQLQYEGVREVLDVLENDQWMIGLNIANNGDVSDAITRERFASCFKVNSTCLFAMVLEQIFLSLTFAVVTCRNSCGVTL